MKTGLQTFFSVAVNHKMTIFILKKMAQNNTQILFKHQQKFYLWKDFFYRQRLK